MKVEVGGGGGVVATEVFVAVGRGVVVIVLVDVLDGTVV